MIDPTRPTLREAHVDNHRRRLAEMFERQYEAVLDRYGPDLAASYMFDRKNWSRELTALVQGLNTETAERFGEITTELLNGAEFAPAIMANFLAVNARRAGVDISRSIHSDLSTALEDEDPQAAIGEMFGGLIGTTAGLYARQMVTTAANLGTVEGAKQGNAAMKGWRVNSGNPRSGHASMNGIMVGIRDDFPNGMAWPGDPAGGAENNANCACSVVFVEG